MQFYGAEPQHDLTYSDVFLVPSRSEVSSRLEVELAPDDATGMTIPLVSSNMNAVTGPRMAAAMARRGGLGVIPQDAAIDEAHDAIAWVKAQHPLITPAFECPADAVVAKALERVPAVAGFGVAVTGPDGEPLDIIEARALGRMPADARLGDLRHLAEAPLTLDDVRDPRRAFDLLEQRSAKFAPISDGGRLIGTLSQQDALRATLYQPALDAHGRLRVAVAVGANGRPAERARDLVAAGADVLVLDTAHGHQGTMLRAIEQMREADLGVPIVAGNVVAAAGTRDLIHAGASIVKVGVGPGAMCTTRMMTAVGRPQFSAVLECAEVAASLGGGVWADGGVRYPRDVALALAAGGAAVMIGSWFAGTVEAPGLIMRDSEGRDFKRSFGMASTRAVEGRFGSLSPYERARKRLFAEGISDSTILLDPLRPSVDDLIDMITTGVRSSFTYAGAATLAEFAERAKVGIQSASGYEEGKALPVSW